ncbi:hypothetical protein [Rhizorhabdus dicambivorans]|uniref:VanZ family protein n=1 Tax=Rhizorhabdus dicambivorans TaxID=1850238 RepID=A0A2A4FXN3_9SPHN|nr:hypothetical protein [Rhizorhabdus dicambivorans]ATE65276.1 hypothetical protein CMV14_13395 [Rhizorhabdus dicambivorans]PCE42481.1 hypothetical protein COO09_10385 [Rhizorhabdus dicambivorans]
MKLYRRFAVQIFWTTLGVVYGLAIMPSQQAPDLGAGDKVNHIAAFLTLAILGRAAYRAHPAWRLALGLSLFGALVELTQAIPVLHRDASIWDWVADSAATLVALSAALALERRSPRRATA